MRTRIGLLLFMCWAACGLSVAAQESSELAATLAREREKQAAPNVPSGFTLGGDLAALNPQIAAVIDLNAHYDNSDEGISHTLEEVDGFGHAHGGGDEHEHDAIENGFNLRHVELSFSASIDPYFEGYTIAAVDADGAELEEAVIQTTALPGGFKLKGGKFFSGFGRINSVHAHAWDFVDAPLVQTLLFGEHGLNEKGVQLSWLAPTPFQALFGIEALQGENEKLFASVEDGPLTKRDGPRTFVGWAKFAPVLDGPHAAQFGLSLGRGRHQEAHDGDSDGTNDHWLDGYSTFWGSDFVYKYDDPRPLGEGDWIVEGEYIQREKDLDVVQHDLDPALTGNTRLDRQDGYYLQTTYGILPRWRAGLRWEQVGLINRAELPNGTVTDYDPSSRLSAMVDFSPSEFSRLRLQVSQAQYRLDGDAKDVVEVYLQWVITLGSHGAHRF